MGRINALSSFIWLLMYTGSYSRRTRNPTREGVGTPTRYHPLSSQPYSIRVGFIGCLQKHPCRSRNATRRNNPPDRTAHPCARTSDRRPKHLASFWDLLTLWVSPVFWHHIQGMFWSKKSVPFCLLRRYFSLKVWTKSAKTRRFQGFWTFVLL